LAKTSHKGLLGYEWTDDDTLRTLHPIILHGDLKRPW